MNRVMNPVSTRVVPVPHRLASTDRPSGCFLALPLRGRAAARSSAWVNTNVVGTSPSVTSTQAGIRMHSHAPATITAALKNSAPPDPVTTAIPEANPPTTVVPTRPNTVIRELLLTRLTLGGSTLGITDDLSTPNDLLSTRIPSAAG